MEGVFEVGREQPVGAGGFTKGDVDYANTGRVQEGSNQNAVLHGNLVCVYEL